MTAELRNTETKMRDIHVRTYDEYDLEELHFTQQAVLKVIGDARVGTELGSLLKVLVKIDTELERRQVDRKEWNALSS